MLRPVQKREPQRQNAMSDLKIMIMIGWSVSAFMCPGLAVSVSFLFDPDLCVPSNSHLPLPPTSLDVTFKAAVQSVFHAAAICLPTSFKYDQE